MDLQIIVAGTITFLLVISFFVFRKKKPEPKVHTNTPIKKNFHGVSITPCANSCAQAVEYQHKRFLPNEAPTLPLPECNKHCTCTYKHHNDRRTGADRRALSIKMGEQNADHRELKGRRKVDQFKKPSDSISIS
jgi:hypothetical protein